MLVKNNPHIVLHIQEKETLEQTISLLQNLTDLAKAVCPDANMRGLHIGMRPALDFVAAKKILESLQREILDVYDDGSEEF